MEYKDTKINKDIEIIKKDLVEIKTHLIEIKKVIIEKSIEELKKEEERK